MSTPSPKASDSSKASHGWVLTHFDPVGQGEEREN